MFGAAHVTAAVVSPRVAATAVGASGTPHGITAADAADAAPHPARLRARTVNCWGWPLGRLAQRIDVAVVVFVAPVDRIWTWYSMIGSPPFGGAPQFTVIVLSPRSPTGGAGASGWRSGCSGADGELNSPSPLALTARTWNVYSRPLVRPSHRKLPTAPMRWMAEVPPPIWMS